MEENNQQEKTVEQEVAEEAAKAETAEDPSGEGAELKAEEEGEYVDLTKSEVQEEEKFQETVNAAEALDTPEKVEEAKEEITQETNSEPPEIQPKQEIENTENTETTEGTTTEIPTKTANIIKDQDLIFLQYECENPECAFKFYVNSVEKGMPDKLKCLSCGKKKSVKRRLMDVTLKAYKDYAEEAK